MTDKIQDLQKSVKGLSLGSDDQWATELLPTGIPILDHAMGGGWGRGRLSELYGNFSSGKSLVLLMTLAENQRRGGVSILKSTENDFNAVFFERLGGDPKKLILVGGGDAVEDVFDSIMEVAEWVTKNEEETRVCYGWDGIAASSTRHLQKEGMDKRDMSKSGLMSQGCQLITESVKRANMCVIATNQTREKIGTYVPTDDTPGGRAWKFHSSQRVSLDWDGSEKGSQIKVEETINGKKVAQEVGRWIRGQVHKNKLASPLARFRLPIYTEVGYPHPVYDGKMTTFGIDIEESLFDYYLTGRFVLNAARERVVHCPSSGWYALHKSIDPSETKFRQKDWPDKLKQFPKLRTLLYDDLEKEEDVSGTV